jgi:Flp pilus assembly protein TadG
MIEKAKSNSGQTIMEFAFILVLLLILILGIMEFSIVLYDKAILTDACREGARAGVVFRADPSTFAYSPLSAAEIRTVVNNHLQDRLVTFGAPFNPATDINVTWNPAPPTRGGELDIQVNFTYTFLALPNLGSLGTGTLDLAARSIMRME